MAESTILEAIVAQRVQDVRAAKALHAVEALQAKLSEAPRTIDFEARLRADSPMALIAEVKRASPSKGDIALDADAAKRALQYAAGGAAAISVLTEPKWFKGTLDDMLAARRAVDDIGPNRPAILRKDFLIDDYQVLEARTFGADAVLLIVACLSQSALTGLLACTRSLGMEALVEVNNAEEMKRAAKAGARVIGINNRDLRDFTVDLGTTDRLATSAPAEALLAALSGISNRDDVARFQAAGAGAVLVGEALMSGTDPAAKVRELLGR